MTTKKEEEKPKPKKVNDYNLSESLNTLEISEMLKTGFQYYINTNNVKINSDKQLESELTKFKKMNAGA